MAEQAHTPGPWTVFGDPGESYGIEAAGLSVVVWGDGSETECGVQGETPAEALANAHLIAAAPDMRATLQSMASYIQLWGLDVVTGLKPTAESLMAARDEVNAALAKSEGRS